MPGTLSGDLQAENERLRAENDELRLRLDEAEQAIEAIRNGQVESLVVEGPNGPRIFSLEGASHSYRILVEAMSEGAATLSDDGSILYCNARFAALLNSPLERVIGSSILVWIPETFRSHYAALVLDAGEGDSRGELSLHRKHKQDLLVRLSIRAFCDDGRHLLCVIATDQGLLNEVQELAHLGGWEYDVVKRQVTWTEELYRIHGVSRDTYDPNSMARNIQFYAPEDQRQLAQLFQNAVEKGEPYDREVQFINAHGSRLWVRTMGRAQREGSEIVRVYGNIMDITERRHTEARLQKVNEELIRSNQELEQFAYVASHDLQEPLRTISSYTQLLAMRYEGQLDRNAQDFIGYAVQGAQRMQSLIEALLSYSRVVKRGQPLETLEPSEALGEALKNLEFAIEESDATITSDKLPAVLGDRIQIIQLFQNLVANGIKFRKPGEPPHLALYAKRDGNAPFWTFSVTDNGIGIEERYLDRLFVIFRRLHTHQEFPGTGIGLAICKRIVERHGGRIWLESTPGCGTTVRFTLPAKIEDNGHGNNDSPQLK